MSGLRSMRGRLDLLIEQLRPLEAAKSGRKLSAEAGARQTIDAIVARAEALRIERTDNPVATGIGYRAKFNLLDLVAVLMGAVEVAEPPPDLLAEIERRLEYLRRDALSETLAAARGLFAWAEGVRVAGREIWLAGGGGR